MTDSAFLTEKTYDQSQEFTQALKFYTSIVLDAHDIFHVWTQGLVSPKYTFYSMLCQFSSDHPILLQSSNYPSKITVQ